LIEAANEKLHPEDSTAVPDPTTALRYIAKAISLCGATPALLLLQAQTLLARHEYDSAAKIATYVAHALRFGIEYRACQWCAQLLTLSGAATVWCR
jgi:hypothetical protein